jgi:hypothetical protein
MRTYALENVSQDALAEKTSRGRFIKRLGSSVAIGLGIAGVVAATASAETWHCCRTPGSLCDQACGSVDGFDCNSPNCGYWCNCINYVGCFDTTSGPC